MAPEQLVQTVNLARQLGQARTDASTLFATIGQSLLPTPDVVLDSLGWTDEPPTANGGVKVNLDAGLSPFDGNYRAAMRRIEEFMQTLQAMPGVHDVTLRSSPVNADSSSTLSGMTLNADASAPAARFSLSLLFREARP
jgi:hypothetical protein